MKRILSDADIGIATKIEKLIQTGMSDFQMANFVIGEQITPWRKAKQAIVEVMSRLDVATMTAFSIEEKELDIRFESAKSGNLDERERLRADISVRRMTHELERLKRKHAQCMDEASFFMNMFNNICVANYGSVDGYIEKLSDANFIAAEEKLFWTEKLTNDAVSDVMSTHMVSKGTYNALTLLGDVTKHLFNCNTMVAGTVGKLRQITDARLNEKD